jgi:membrane protease subunit (stomatin/prohibitin family)
MSGDLDKFTKYQVANAIPLAAQNEGGIAGVGAGLAAGAVLGQTMAHGLAGSGGGGVGGAPVAATAPAAPAPAAAAPATAGPDPEARLGQLKNLVDKGLISAAEYDAAKAEVIRKLVG